MWCYGGGGRAAVMVVWRGGGDGGVRMDMWWGCGRRGDVVVVASVVVEDAKGWRLVLSWHGDRGGEGDGMMMVVRWASVGGRKFGRI
ncbi:hypothetical protein Tco_1045978 [Tanacetum coccineum]